MSEITKPEKQVPFRGFRGKSLRFLFFLYYYPPTPGTPANRNSQISNELLKKSSYSLILTSSRQEQKTQLSEAHHIEAISAFDYRSLIRSKTKDGALPEEKKKSKIMQALVRLVNTFPFNIIIGEGGMFYFFTLIRKGQRAINVQGITHLYSSYRPFTDHYAAFVLKKRNPRLFWIADFRDLMIDPHYNHIMFPFAQHRFYKRIFKKADLITTVSDGLAKHLIQYNPNVITLRNGINFVPQHIPEEHCKYFKIAYTGSMFLDKRNAEPLFKALHELSSKDLVRHDEIRIVYAGKDSHYWINMAKKFSLDSILTDKSIVTAAEAKEIQQNACINLLLTIASDQLQGVLTGKMIEYFESGSPVLAIVVNQNDSELGQILSELEIGKSFSDQSYDLPGMRDFIYQEYLHWKRTGTNRKPVNLEVLREKYSVEVTMKPLFEKVIRRLNP